MCFNETCQNCTVENDNCTDDEDAVPRCGILMCFNETCQNCIAENHSCTDAEDMHTSCTVSELQNPNQSLENKVIRVYDVDKIIIQFIRTV